MRRPAAPCSSGSRSRTSNGARFLVADVDSGTERWRWLKGVLEVRLIDD